MPKTAFAALGFAQFFDNFDCGALKARDDHLGDAVAAMDEKRFVAQIG